MQDPVAQTVLDCIPAGRPVTANDIRNRWPRGAPALTKADLDRMLAKLVRAGILAKQHYGHAGLTIYERRPRT